MKLSGIAFIAVILLFAYAVAFAAAVTTDHDSVRKMCALKKGQDFSVFDKVLLPGILIDIIENDPADAKSHEAVITNALKALAATMVPETVPVLIEQVDRYPLVCLPLLGEFADPDAVNAIVKFVNDKKPSIQVAACEALAKLPPPSDKTGKDYIVSLEAAFSVVASKVAMEEDDDVAAALFDATMHLMNITLQSGSFQDDFSGKDFGK
jgi:hypothetical protein